MINLENEFIKISIKKLEWDTAHFGISMASMEVKLRKEIESYKNICKDINKSIILAKDNGIQHITLMIDPSLNKVIHSCEANGFKLMDTRVQYIFDYNKAVIKKVSDKCKLRAATKEDKEAVINIAKESFTNYSSRFKTDENIDNKKADEMYLIWVENSFNGYADIIYVAEDHGKIVGFATFKEFVEDDETGHRIGEIVLTAVAPEARGKGIYTSMINYGVKLGKGKMDYLLMKTQIDNFGSRKTWESANFKSYKNQYIFHLFIE